MAKHPWSVKVSGWSGGFMYYYWMSWNCMNSEKVGTSWRGIKAKCNWEGTYLKGSSPSFNCELSSPLYCVYSPPDGQNIPELIIFPWKNPLGIWVSNGILSGGTGSTPHPHEIILDSQQWWLPNFHQILVCPFSICFSISF